MGSRDETCSTICSRAQELEGHGKSCLLVKGHGEVGTCSGKGLNADLAQGRMSEC